MPLEIITQEEAEKKQLAKTATLKLVENDRPLDAEEIEAEELAAYFPISKFKRIKPLPGTLAFYLRNFKGRNEAVANFLINLRKTNNSAWLRDFCKLWPALDDYSKKRIDVFDLFCNKFGVRIEKFWGVLQESIFWHNDALTQTALSEYKPQFVEILKKHVDKPKNAADRKLMAEALNLTKGAQFTVNETHVRNQINNTQINNVSNVPSFAKSIRRTEVNGSKPKELEEGKQDYIDTEFSVKEEKEKVERKIA